MKITSKNYIKEFDKLNGSSLPSSFLKSHEMVMKVTSDGTDWSKYNSNETFKRVIDLYFEKLTEFIGSQKKSNKKEQKSNRKEKNIEDVLLDSPNVRSFVPLGQQRVLVNDHISVIQQLEKNLSEIPKMGVQDGLSNDEIIVHAHYFYGSSDWFILESDRSNGEMFAYTILNGDSPMSEFGYLSIQELRENPSIEIDFYWKPKSLASALYKADSSFFAAPKKNTSTTKKPKSSSETKVTNEPTKKKESLRKRVTKKAKPSNSTAPKRLPRKPKPQNVNATKVELVDLELKFIRRYLNMNGKEKTHNQIRLFLNSLQKAIIERRIRKTSDYAAEIMKIQKDLIRILPDLKKRNYRIDLSQKLVKEYSKLIGKQVERESTKLIKSYVNLQNKHIENKQANNLLVRITRALKNGKITSNDKYIEQINDIRLNLESFVEKNKRGGFLPVASAELNGIAGNVSSMGLKNTVMRSTDFMRMRFDKLNFQGKWLRFIGNPSPGFSTMIFGMPKTGKSYLMIEFAGYLARNHGAVLYVAKEEELDDTLQTKLRDKEVQHAELYVSDILPQDLSPYDFVFLDSVTKMRLKPEDLVKLGKRYPRISFVYVFQATKHGAFRGSNEFQHDVDVVIEVPEKGIATQFGRFNQGATMKIFND